MKLLLLTAVLLQTAPADRVQAMKKGSASFSGKEGIVIPLGDSIP